MANVFFWSNCFFSFCLYKLETAQPKNIFLDIWSRLLVGIIFNETIGFSFYSLGLSVGIAVTLMVYLKVMHPPAASNPLVVLFTDVSFEFILFPVIAGTIAIIIMSVFINKIILKRKYPNKMVLNYIDFKNLFKASKNFHCIPSYDHLLLENKKYLGSFAFSKTFLPILNGTILSFSPCITKIGILIFFNFFIVSYLSFKRRETGK